MINLLQEEIDFAIKLGSWLKFILYNRKAKRHTFTRKFFGFEAIEFSAFRPPKLPAFLSDNCQAHLIRLFYF